MEPSPRPAVRGAREARGPRAGWDLPNRDVGRPSVRRSVINYIKELIFDGKLRAGDRVPQDDVARALGVSNTPVREALIALEHEGLVTIELHRGAVVNPLSVDGVRLQYELYALVFGWAVRRTISRVDDALVAELRDIAKRARTAGPDEFFELMTAFTLLLERTTGSRDWVRLIDALQRVVPRHSFYEKVPGALEGAREAFGPVVRAIERRRVDQAVTAIERWNQRHGDALVAELQRRGLFAAPAPLA
jgi:DNA-binding GntR family transcriptional regulator